MRLIDADKLKEELSYKSPAPDFDIDSVILGVIDEQPTVAASPWHRVEDELPKSGEFGEIVLACNDVGTVKAAYLLNNGKWYAANNTDWDAWTWMPNVTHWMHLPEPPKGVCNAD